MTLSPGAKVHPKRSTLRSLQGLAPAPDAESQKGPTRGTFLRSSLMHFYSDHCCAFAAALTQIRNLIREMSRANWLWGAPRTHGELLKLGMRTPNRPSPSTWSNVPDDQAKAGRRSCVT